MKNMKKRRAPRRNRARSRNRNPNPDYEHDYESLEIEGRADGRDFSVFRVRLGGDTSPYPPFIRAIDRRYPLPWPSLLIRMSPEIF